MKELLGQVDGQLKIVIGVAIFALAAFRWFVARRDLQSTRRVEFLQHWKSPSELDVVSIEVLTRQLFGAYLPAPLVRRICNRHGTEVCKTLGELGDVWSLVEWDNKLCVVRWKSKAHSVSKRQRWTALYWAMYFASGFAGGVILLSVSLAPTTMDVPVSVGAAMWGLLCFGVAGAALWRTDAWGAALRLGDLFLDEVNLEAKVD